MNSIFGVFVECKKKKLKKIIEKNNNGQNSPLYIGLISTIVELCTPRQNMVKMQYGVIKI